MNNANALFNNGTHHPAFNQPFDQPSNSQNFLDPAVAFGGNGINPNALDLGQFANPQQLQRGPDGLFRDQSPAGYQLPSYQVNQVIPAKRSRPVEENAGASPAPGSDNMRGSRSHTPQQGPFPNQFGGQPGTQPYQQPQTPYPPHFNQQQHAPPQMHQGSPSPMQQGQQFRPQGLPPQSGPVQSPGQFANHNPGVGTFPPAQQNGGPFPGMAQPPNNVMYARAMQAGRGYAGGPGLGPTGMPPSYGGMPGNQAQNFQEAQRRYQAQLQQAQQQAGQSRPPSTQQQAGGQPPNRQIQSQIQQQGQTSPLKMNEQSFTESLQKYMSSRGQSLEPDPRIGGRHVSYFQLFYLVTQHKILNPGPTLHKWSLVTQQLGCPESQYPTAPEEAKGLFQRNLLGFYQAWAQLMQRRRAQMQQQFQGGAAGNRPSQHSPVQQSQPLGQPGAPASTPQSQNVTATSQPPPPNVQASPQPNSSSLPATNGVKTPQQSQTAHATSPAPSKEKRPPSSGTKAQSQQAPPPPMQTPKQTQMAPGGVRRNESVDANQAVNGKLVNEADESLDQQETSREDDLDTYGGIDLDADLIALGRALGHSKPSIPAFEEMGVVDIHALTKSLESGIRAEMRLALDQLTVLSCTHMQHPFQLAHCEELVEALIECAKDQVQLLVDGSSEADSELCLPNMEVLIKRVRAEKTGIQSVEEYGSLEFELDRAVDRLISVLTILCNFSFVPNNPDVLAVADIVEFMASVIDHAGKRKRFLRSARNAKDFMVIMITILSNIAPKIRLSSREDALSVLDLILAFAPRLQFTESQTEPLRFAPYDPQLHRYLPCAVDSLAKILARDDPNRSFYRSIFSDSSTAGRPYELLTRAFALAISPIPDRAKTQLYDGIDRRIAEARKPLFAQGMLAADILSTFVHGRDGKLARSWLESEDGWAPNLLHLVLQLAMPRQDPATGRPISHELNFGLVTRPALSMLRRLVEKVEPDEHGLRFDMSGLLPRTESVIGALTHPEIDQQALRQVVAFANLDG